EYFSIPWDVGARKAKELLFESRFIDAEEAAALGFVGRVIPAEDLERETLAYARRVAESSRFGLRLAKMAVNRTQDLQGYTAAVEAGFHDYLVAARLGGAPRRVEGPVRRLKGVDLALRGERGERPGQAAEES
ncbi:MAG: enoyl-CoA hydratase-related protein, partial [Tepidiformaceae bacterium]